MEQLDLIQRRLKPDLDAMNSLIASFLHTHNEMMDSVVKEYLLTKGKQIRPIMVLLGAGMFGSVNDHTLHAAAALEMLHNASLIHDDIVDETPLRRGRPTINNVWGNHVAVLVGDFFVSNALAAAIGTDSIDIISAVSALGKELSLGEIDQICNVRDNNFSEESYFRMIDQKTASLFRNCVSMGARTAGASDEELAPLVEFAELLGLCFQIKDDIFDYYDDPKIGKPTGNDLREGKVTLPLLYALASAPVEKSAPMREMLCRPSLTDEEIRELIAFAIESGGIDYAFRRMREMQRRAAGILDVYPDSECKRSLLDIFDFIISRDR